MGVPRSKPRKSSSQSQSALEAERRELAAKENELQAQIAAIQRAITEAPRKARETAEQERNAILNATRGGGHRLNTLVDTRYVVEPPRRGKGGRPMLRAEVRAARLQALALLVLLGVALAWAACKYL